MIQIIVIFVQYWVFCLINCKKLAHVNQDSYEISYLSALQDSQNQLRQSLRQFTNQINSLNQTLSLVQNIPSMKVVAFQQQISNQRDLLYQIQSNQELPYSLKTFDCKNFTTAQIDQLSKNIKSIETDLASYKQKLDSLSADPLCQVCEELMKEYNSSKLFLSKLKALTSSSCLTQTSITNISNYANMTNLGVSNWIGENITLAQYYMKKLNKTTQMNTTKCPLTAPFVLQGTSTCVNCTQQKPYFSLKTEQCVQCPQLTVFDIVIHECKQCPITAPIFLNGQCKQCPKGTVFNSKFHNCSCPSNYVYNQTSKSCECKEELHNNGTVCVKCLESEFWDAKIKKCLNCSNNQVFNKTLKKCVAIVCQSNFIFNTTTKNCSCPTNLPNYNGSRCIQCSQNLVWNSTIKKCQCPKNLPNYNGSACLKQCQQSLIWNSTIKKCQCPKNLPNYNGSACLKQCQQSLIWNLTLKKCVLVSNGTSSCIQNQIYNASSKKCQCPQQSPFFDGKNCISCFLPKYWNLDKLKCEQCQIGYKYDLVAKVCFECPQQYPFSDGKNCVACYLPNYWDYSSRKCLTCPQNTSYKSDKLKCE